VRKLKQQAFRESALMFCGRLSPADFHGTFKRLEEQSREDQWSRFSPLSSDHPFPGDRFPGKNDHF